MSDRYLKGRAAWVTGGATGMGRAVAVALAQAGADVAIGSLVDTAREGVVPGQNVYTPSLDEMAGTRDAIAAHGVRALARPLDVCSNESVDAFHTATIETFGRIDILVNAAGSSTRHVMVDHPDALWQRMLETNLTGPYRTIKRCMAGMIERKWGRIINVASTAASVGYVAHGAYCASKAGLLGLTRCVALEGAPHGISCNAISPGWVDTPQGRGGVRQQMRLEGFDDEQAFRARILEGIPQKRFIQPSEIGAVAAFLCRDDALAITMQDLTVSAGTLW
jgi:NAD(P)-dependent dehydrogenase (short-subunit alcohol dehydrogenase family)